MNPRGCVEILEDNETFCDNTQSFPCLGCLLLLCRVHEHDPASEHCADLADMLGDDELREWRAILRERLSDLLSGIDYTIQMAGDPTLARVCLVVPCNPASRPLYEQALRAIAEEAAVPASHEEKHE